MVYLEERIPHLPVLVLDILFGTADWSPGQAVRLRLAPQVAAVQQAGDELIGERRGMVSRLVVQSRFRGAGSPCRVL